MISDDGMFSAEYVQPPALSIPLGNSGSSVEVRRNENLTFSAMIGGEWVMITADTTVTAANGNVYAAVLSPEGIPIGVMHVAAMQDVMLGDLGGTIKLTQAEDMTWWLGEAEVKDGYVHTAANGNMYVLMMDAEGMWSAMYQQVMVTVTLGTQGSIELVRAEDMSWWYGSEAVMVGSEVDAANGNTYSLWYTDGIWTARFEPASMEIMGTGGLMVYSREADDMYDVESAGSGMTLDASGAGEITTSAGAMYRVMMMDGMLSGARFDAAKKDPTRYRTVGLEAHIGYIADDPETDLNEASTGIVIAGEKLPFDGLLGHGHVVKEKAAADGAPGEFVSAATKKLIDLRAEAELYAIYQAENPGTQDFDNNLNRIADDAQTAVDTIFDKRPANLLAPSTSEVSADLPREAANDTTVALRAVDTVRALTRLIDAMSSQEAFVDATAKGGNGVFENALGKAAAEKAFSANKSAYEVLFGTTGSTRYGAISLMQRVGDDPDLADDGTYTAVISTKSPAAAVYDTKFSFDGFNLDTNDDDVINDDDDPVGREDIGRLGAFAYATAAETKRARVLPQTGGASYIGGTVAVTPGTAQDHQLYQGTMRVDVNFRRSSVFGRISELKDVDGNLWKYLDRDVSEIYLPRRFYDSLARFGGSSDTDTANAEGVVNNDMIGDATIVYSDTHGFPLPTATDTKGRFSGRFIGSDGAEIAGVWSLGEASVRRAVGDTEADAGDDARDIIYGSYGVMLERERPLPGETANDDASSGGANQARLAGGTAEYKGTRTDGILRLGKYLTGGDANNDFKLTDIFATPYEDPRSKTNNSDTHVTRVVDFIEKQLEIYDVYTTLEDDSTDPGSVSNAGRQRIWINIINYVRSELFGRTALAHPVDGNGDADRTAAGVQDLDLQSPLGSIFFPLTRTENPDDDAARERIQALLDALSSADALDAALTDNAGGVFDNMPYLLDDSSREDSQTLATTARPFPVGGRTVAQIFGARGAQTKLWSLSTNYTRFGVWFRQEQAQANVGPSRHSNPEAGDPAADIGTVSPNNYAYSWLTQSSYRRDRVEQTYPSEGLATYTGNTLAVLDDKIFKGDAEVKVTWAAVPASGDPDSRVLPKFSNFRQVTTNDPLRLGGRAQNHNDPSGAPIVDEISFLLSATDENMMVSHDAESGQLGVTYTTGIRARISQPTSIAVVDRDAATFDAVFVGESLDGPLGITGLWTIRDFNGTTNDNTNNDLIGAFGADLSAFETLFLP
ncbi:MAG: hypothetical protein OXL38_07465 [Gammaproteobacteria bacterium]|nr:hypothetical protein [Gammaproteobacteria bacterium]